MLFRAIQGAGGAGGALPTYVTYNSSAVNTGNLANPSFGTLSIGSTPPADYNRYVFICIQGLIQNITVASTLYPILGGVSCGVESHIADYVSGSGFRNYYVLGLRLLNTGTTATVSLGTPSNGYIYGSGVGCYSVYVPIGQTLSFSSTNFQDTNNTGGNPTTSMTAAKDDVLFAFGGVRDVSPVVFSGDFTLDFSVDTQSSDGFGMGDLIPTSAGTYTVTVVGVAASRELAAISKFIVS